MRHGSWPRDGQLGELDQVLGRPGQHHPATVIIAGFFGFTEQLSRLLDDLNPGTRNAGEWAISAAVGSWKTLSRK
jgi:hypothetical protein